jgi:hypothetical protein
MRPQTKSSKTWEHLYEVSGRKHPKTTNFRNTDDESKGQEGIVIIGGATGGKTKNIICREFNHGA